MTVTTTTFLANLPLAFGIVIGVLMIVPGLLLTATGLLTLRQWYASRRWPVVPARIVTSRVSEVACFEDQIMFKPDISYTFLTPGGHATGDDIAFTGKLFSTREQAAKALAPYQSGMMVKVRYNPEKPAEAVLVRKGALAGLLILLLGLGIIAGVLVAAQGAGLPAARIGTALAALFVILAATACWTGSRLNQARRTGLYPPPGAGSDRDVERLIRQGEKGLAIRLYRELHGTDLKTSRIKVEELAANQRQR